MKWFLAGIFFLIEISCQAQQEQLWLQELESPSWPKYQLRPENELEENRSNDFSSLLFPHSAFLGYIGDNFKRLQISILSVTQDSTDLLLYHVKGVSLSGSNRCDFSGTIRLTQLRRFAQYHYGVDNKFKGKAKSEGVLIGSYEFLEDSRSPHSGIFKGVMTNYWYRDMDNAFRYDDIELHSSDRYRNNQYIGTWQAYKSATVKVCNWGEYRIPFSGDLDVGAGEFSPNPKYHSQGWKTYVPN